MESDDRVTFDHEVYAYDHDDPFAGRFAVAVLLPHKLRSKEEKGYLLVLSHREPGRSSVDRFPVHHDHLPGEEEYDPKDPHGGFPGEVRYWIQEWAAERVEDVVNRRLGLRGRDSVWESWEEGRLAPWGERFGNAPLHDDVWEELRAFFLRPGAAGFLEAVREEAPDVATWLGTFAPERSFEIETVVPSADT